MKEKQKRLGAHLRRLRLARQLTQEKLAELVGVHPTHIAKIEAGDRLPSLDALFRFGDVLEMPVSELVRPLDDMGEVDEDPINVEIQGALRGCDSQQLKLVRDLINVVRRHDGTTRER